MTTATTQQLPAFAVKLADALAHEFDARVEAERTGLRDNVRFIVRSDGFSGTPHMERQRKIWEVVDRTITDEESLSISLIMAAAPED